MKSFLTRLENGEKIELSPNCFMVFIDETGEENFSDTNYPIFGLGACIILEKDYDKIIRKPWFSLKEDEFEGKAVVLHAAEKNKKGYTAEQVKRLASFFKNSKFGRAAVTITNKTCFEYKIEPYHIVARKLLDGILKITNTQNGDSFAFIFENSDRGNKLAKRYFSLYNIMKTANEEMPVVYGFVSKKKLNQGLRLLILL